LEWFAIVNQSSKTNIKDYANGAGINYFTPSGQTTPVPFNNIVTTFMTDMNQLFGNASNFNQNISSWDTSSVTTMYAMFYNARAFNNNGSTTIGNWDTSKVTTMDYMFNDALVFNQNISSWNVNKVVNKSPTYFSTGSALANNPANIPYWYLTLDANNVTVKSTLSSLPSSPIPLFVKANVRGTLEWFAIVNNSSKANITNYARGIATDGSSIFIPTGQAPTVTTPVPFNNIVTTFMTDMNGLFANATEFNSDISSWDTSKVTDMSLMFQNASVFNQNIGNWNTSIVTNMNYMFLGASAFNNNGSATIGNWNTSSVANMSYMFYSAQAFNQNISSWNTSSVTTMDSMFENATVFNQNISIWVVNNVSHNDFSAGSALNNNPVNMPSWYLSLDANGVTVKSTMPLLPSSPIPLFVQANLRGTLEWFAIVNNSSKTNITNYANGLVTDGSSIFIPTGQNPALTTPVLFNNIVTTFMTDMSSLFEGASTFNSYIGSWDTSRVTTMNNMFNGATIFNQNITSWNVNNLSSKPQQPTNFSTGSALASSPRFIPYWSGLMLDANGVTVKCILSSISSSPTFIQANLRGTLEWFAVVDNSSKEDITNYAYGISSSSSKFIPTGQTPALTTPVPFNNIVTTFMTDMSGLFLNVHSFNSDISSWDTSKVTTMWAIFANAYIFNQNIGNWNTSKVTSMSYIFYGASAFNNNGSATIGNWNTSSVTDMNFMFENATIFYQNISSWNVNKVTPLPPYNFSTGSALNNNNAFKPVGFY
jgi:surface protein